MSLERTLRSPKLVIIQLGELVLVSLNASRVNLVGM